MQSGSRAAHSGQNASIYKVYVMSDNDVMFKFSAAAKRWSLDVLLFARREVRNTPFASHARVKGLYGKELVVKRSTSFLSLFIDAYRLNKAA